VLPAYLLLTAVMDCQPNHPSKTLAYAYARLNF
jgi:hypothetical protein